ncbi:uncharacterized protein isoform X2 [Choristoneura fumiferana]|uniref:uncharacterized protein isoform X2 n=1 Tax=Choristoneura fumiferana TaxID=7141 RepID=UPI003D15777C
MIRTPPVTRSKSRAMPNIPAPSVAPSALAVETSQPINVDIPQQSGSRLTFSKARSARTAQTRSSRSSTAVKAQKAAVEALALRRQLEREQKLAAREREREKQLAEQERERERQLAALQQQVEQSELIAELAAIDADASSCAGSRVSSNRVSVDRTNKWVEHHRHHTEFTHVNKVIPVVECEQHSVPSPSPSPVLQPTATRATAPFINDHDEQTQPRFIAKTSEAVGTAPPTVSPDLAQQATLLRAVADTAAAAKALASAQGVKKLDLFPFSGNTLQWLQFKRIYDVTKNNFSALENINRLQNAIRGPAREAVAALLMAAEDPEVVIRALEDNFARPELIVFKEVSSLKNLPRLGNDLKELGTLSNRLSVLEPT